MLKQQIIQDKTLLFRLQIWLKDMGKNLIDEPLIVGNTIICLCKSYGAATQILQQNNIPSIKEITLLRANNSKACSLYLKIY